jgi:hypothetical protein
MSEKLKRREMVKAVAAMGGLLALGGVASAAEPERNAELAGEWLKEGKRDEPCAIFQQGRVLLLVNEKGELATGRMTGPRKLATVSGWGRDEPFAGEIGNRGNAITWANDSVWKRP